MGSEAKVPLGVVGVAAFSQLAEDLSQIVGDQAEMAGVGGIGGFLELPARYVGMDTVVEGRIHLLGHGIEEIGSTNNRLDISIDVADENDRPFCGNDVAATAEGAIFHVTLHDVDTALVREADASRFIERHHIPETHQTTLT